MVKKSTKSKSKRIPLGQKYRSLKKAKEKARKAKRDAKKLAKQQPGRKKRQMKDPGVPAAWPFRDEFLKEMAWERQKILAEKKKKKEERKELRKALAGEGDNDDEVDAVEALKAEADDKQLDFEQMEEAHQKLGENSVQGHIDRSFYKEFKKVVELADVIIEVLDARDPLSCRSPEVESFVKSSGSEKRLILLMNKIDLVPKDVVEKWLKHLREELPTVAFKASTQKQHHNLGQARNSGLGGKSKTQMCLGGETLLQLLKNYTRNRNLKTAITVGIVGMPNVGKSSVINSLKRTRVAHVGNRPGVTTSVQEVHLDKHIRLLDSPGIVSSPNQGPLQGCIKLESIEDPHGVIQDILKRVSREKLSKLYSIGEFETADQFLQLAAASRGKLKKGGVPDIQAVAKIVVQDWNCGAIPYYTNPPQRQRATGVRFVSNWSKEFDINEVDEKSVLAQLSTAEELEANLSDIMSNFSLTKTRDKDVEAAADLLETATVQEEPGEKLEGSSKEADPIVFKGGEEGFAKMAERSRSKKDLKNVAKLLTDLDMDANDSVPGGDVTAEAIEVPQRKRKKRREPEVNEGPKKPTGLEDEDAKDNEEDDQNVVQQEELPRKRKKAKQSERDKVLYGNEGQFNPHRARADRKRLKKVKKQKEKRNADVGNLSVAMAGGLDI